MGDLVEMRAVSKRFSTSGGEVHAVDGVSQSTGPGEFVSVVGPSGCGKSTLLNMIGGLMRPTTGEISIDGDPVTRPRRDVGMMFQSPVLLQWRSALSNVLLPIELDQGRRAARASRSEALELLEFVGLKGFENRYSWELSGGMQQRVAICRMLIKKPRLLLMDEPFGALDQLTRERMNVELAKIMAASQSAAIFVTHSIGEAVFLSDVIWVMSSRPGRVVGEVQVDLPKPRSLDMMTTKDFQQTVKAVRAVMDEYHGLAESGADAW
jgi:NitT/TauT family transport system ATP-binding protein